MTSGYKEIQHMENFKYAKLENIFHKIDITTTWKMYENYDKMLNLKMKNIKCIEHIYYPSIIYNNIWHVNYVMSNKPIVRLWFKFYNEKYFNNPINHILTTITFNLLTEIIKIKMINFIFLLNINLSINAIDSYVTLELDILNNSKIIDFVIKSIFTYIKYLNRFIYTCITKLYIKKIIDDIFF